MPGTGPRDFLRDRAPQLLMLVGALLLVGALALPGLAQGFRLRQLAPGGAVTSCAEAPFAEVEIDARPRVWLEVARTPQQHQVGLMYRDRLPADKGMLFVYDRPAREGYWMRNTYIPLSIAWIDAKGIIVDIQDMQPLTEDAHAPRAAYWYALEVNQGWFVDNRVAVGQRVNLCLS